MDLLGSAHAYSLFGFSTNLAKALPLFEHAAHLGLQPAMYSAAASYQ
jgi:TPR repeat protein